MRRSLVLISLALALWPATAHAAEPTTAPLAFHGSGFGGYDLSRLDPLTLAPTGPVGDVGEWHGGYSLSPDGSQLASTISHPGLPGTPGRGRVGMRIYDLNTFEVVREFRLGSYASAVGWLAPRRLIAVHGRGVVVADPVEGTFRLADRLDRGGCNEPSDKAMTRNRLVVLFGSTLNAVDDDGQNRHVKLRGMPADCGHLGMAVDPVRELAYVVGTGDEVAVVALRTMRANNRRVPASRVTRVDSTRAQLFGGFQLAVAHVNSRGTPKGVELVDALNRTRRMIDPRAGAAQAAGERLLAYDGRYPESPGGSRGIRVYNLKGRLRDRLLKREVVHALDVVGRFAYARTRGGLRVIDLRTRTVVSRSPLDPATEIEFVVPGGAGR